MLQAGSTLQLEALRLRYARGGAVTCLGGAVLFVVSSAFEGNGAVRGGAIALIGAAATGSRRSLQSSAASLRAVVRDSIFRSNAAACGGAIYCENYPLVLNSTTFESNRATNVSEGGGALEWHKADSSASHHLTATNCSFLANSAYGDGGAVRVAGSVLYPVVTPSGGAVSSAPPTASFTDCTFSGNTASRHGGALHSRSTYPYAARKAQYWLLNLTGKSTFVDNVAGGAGGSLHSSDVAVSAMGAVFRRNRAAADGGALFSTRGALRIHSSSFLANRAGLSAGRGGALRTEQESSQVTNVTFVGQIAAAGGAVYAAAGASSTLTHCTLANNTAALEGGALLSAGNVALNNCTIEGNRANVSRGGAVSNAALLTITNSTLRGNLVVSGLGVGGAVYSAGLLRMKYVLCEGNTASEGGAVYSSSTFDATDSNFTLNGATGGSGGGLYQSFGEASVQDSTFCCNSAAAAAATAAFSGSPVKVSIANGDFVDTRVVLDRFGQLSTAPCSKQLLAGSVGNCKDASKLPESRALRSCSQRGTAWAQCVDVSSRGVKCGKCSAGKVSLDGRTCTLCAGGQLPNADQSRCMLCSKDQYSASGPSASRSLVRSFSVSARVCPR